MTNGLRSSPLAASIAFNSAFVGISTLDFDRAAAGKRTPTATFWPTRPLSDAAAEAGFTSCNDQALIEHYRKLDHDHLQNDRARKARDRERARKVGVIDAEHRADIEMAANKRLMGVLNAMDDPNAPRVLKLLPLQSLQDLRDVWLGREVLRAEHKKCKAPDIARWIKANGYRSDSAVQDKFDRLTAVQNEGSPS